jgi:hypothetical protein
MPSHSLSPDGFFYEMCKIYPTFEAMISLPELSRIIGLPAMIFNPDTYLFKSLK